MITYDQIKSANERVNRLEIKRVDKKTGKTTVKQYACVAERVQAFREICPNGTITTDVQLLPIDDNGLICLATTTVSDDQGNVLAKDNAMEREGSNQINGSSFVENACTSAIGRALASIGLGSETSMASAEEMANALYQQEEEKKEKDIKKTNQEADKKLQQATADKKLQQATFVDVEGDRDSNAERDKCWETIKGLFQMNGKTAEDAQAWVEKRFSLPLDDVDLPRMRAAKLAVVARANG